MLPSIFCWKSVSGESEIVWSQAETCWVVLHKKFKKGERKKKKGNEGKKRNKKEDERKKNERKKKGKKDLRGWCTILLTLNEQMFELNFESFVSWLPKFQLQKLEKKKTKQEKKKKEKRNVEKKEKLNERKKDKKKNKIKKKENKQTKKPCSCVNWNVESKSSLVISITQRPSIWCNFQKRGSKPKFETKKKLRERKEKKI